MTPDDAIDLVDPLRTFCFQRTATTTACNCLAKCVCACLGVYLPPVIANEQYTYLEGSKEWTRLEEHEAALIAASGTLVLASWLNKTGGHGHIAVLRSSSRPGAIRVGAAGLRNFNDAPIEESFGNSIHPDFFTHKGA